jgi:hypothetical protein
MVAPTVIPLQRKVAAMALAVLEQLCWQQASIREVAAVVLVPEEAPVAPVPLWALWARVVVAVVHLVTLAQIQAAKQASSDSDSITPEEEMEESLSSAGVDIQTVAASKSCAFLI